MTDRTADVQAWLEPRADEMAALVQDLVAVDTENPPGRQLGRCGRVLHDSMERMGMSPELIELVATRELEDPCIVRGSVGDGPRTIYFHGHFDVVPAQDPAQFRPLRRDGRITGRGTADMKGGLVSMLYGALAARELGLLEERRIVLHLVCDEETGSVAGSGHLREAGCTPCPCTGKSVGLLEAALLDVGSGKAFGSARSRLPLQADDQPEQH